MITFVMFDYASFALSGVYDSVIVKARNNNILCGEKYFNFKTVNNMETVNNKSFKAEQKRFKQDFQAGS